MKRKLSTIIKRFVLILLLLIISITVLTFFFDAYSESVSAITNRDKSDIWNKEQLDGFSYYTDLVKDEDQAMYRYDSPSYLFPWELDGYKRNDDSLTPSMMLSYARYKEEVLKICDPYVKNLRLYNIYLEEYNIALSIGKRYESSYKSMINSLFTFNELNEDLSITLIEYFNTLGYNGSLYELYEALFYETGNKYLEVSSIINSLDSLDSLVNILLKDIDAKNFYGYNLYIEDYYGSSYSDAILEELPTSSIYEYVCMNNDDYTKEELFDLIRNDVDSDYISIGLESLDYIVLDSYVASYILLVDNEFREYMNYTNEEYLLSHKVLIDESTFSSNKKTSEYNYYELMDKINECNNLTIIQSSIQSKLPSLNDYTKNTLYGYGGVLTITPNSPVLSVTNEDGTSYEFWFNTYYTTFKLVHKDKLGNTIQCWYSNPDEEDPNIDLYIDKNNVMDEITNDQRDLFRVSYSVFAGAKDTLSSYKHSVSDYDSYLNEKVSPTFAIKFDEEKNTFTVWYEVGERGMDYTSFPKYLSSDRYHEVFDRNETLSKLYRGIIPKPKEMNPSNPDYAKYINALKELGLTSNNFDLFTTLYKYISKDDVTNEFNNETDYYELSGYGQSLSVTSIRLLKHIMYELCNYTTDDLKLDNELFDVYVNLNKPSFSFAIEYTLDSDGLHVFIPGNSIKDTKEFPLTTIDLFPYFTMTPMGINGYTIIPDGSGAIMNHDNHKQTIASPYSKRVYTTELAMVKDINPGTSNDLMFPMYSVINNDPLFTGGILAYSLNSGSMLSLNCDVSNRGDNKFNENYYSIYYREKDTLYLSSYDKKALEKWTNKLNSSDVDLTFKLLDIDELDYSSVARVYQTILMNHYDLLKKDTTFTPIMDMNVLSTYSFTDNFVGIPYKKDESLTTINELKEILSTYNALGITNINTFLYGWRKENLENVSFKKIKMSNLIGSKKQFNELLSNKTNNTIYPYVQFGEVEEYLESFGLYHYTSHSVSGDFAIRQEYDLQSNLFKKDTPRIYAISPRYYFVFAKQLTNNMKKLTPSINSLALDKFGSSLSGDYKKGIETFKSQAILETIKSLDYMKNKGIDNITLYTPYDYAFKYTSVAKNISFSATEYELFDYSIPFYQLVCNGLFDYSGTPYNSISEIGEKEYMMRLIETGSNMAYTFTYDSSDELLKTDYNKYYYTLYTNWTSDAKKMYDELNELSIYKGRLKRHERLATDIYKVTYELTSGDIDIYLNYTRNDYSVTTRFGQNIVVPAKSYKMAKRGA